MVTYLCKYVKHTYWFAFPKSVFSTFLSMSILSIPVLPTYQPVWFTLYKDFSTLALLMLRMRSFFWVPSLASAQRWWQLAFLSQFWHLNLSSGPLMVGEWKFLYMLGYIVQHWKKSAPGHIFSSFGLPFWHLYVTLRRTFIIYYYLFCKVNLSITALIIIAHTCMFFLFLPVDMLAG